MSELKLNVAKNLAFGHFMYRDLIGVEVKELDIKKEEVVNNSSADAIFDSIFSMNPRTGLPDGDIAMFMSEKTSPDIRDFIRTQLMSPNGVKADTTFDGLTDDELHEFSRKDFESVTQYRDRLLNFLRESNKPAETNE